MGGTCHVFGRDCISKLLMFFFSKSFLALLEHFVAGILFLSYNHRSGKWPYLKGNYYWRDPFLTSMIMGGSVILSKSI